MIALPEGPPLFTLDVVAAPEHIDELGHVNNTVYVTWAQAIGVAHWRSRASADQQAQWIWVASHLEIDFIAETRLGETLRLDTWVGEPKGARFDRFVRMTGPDGRERARVRTTWVLLNAETRRPARVMGELAALFGG
jgi:acyl-CoA thioester hydrolase